jgi:lipopolysaccharide transport system ATP-binding protein
MRDTPAIRFERVSKVYRLYGSQTDQLINVLGLHRFGIRARTEAREFVALSDIDLLVPRGHRIGIVGRNGAGKTTLLKLICGNVSPSSGVVAVDGTVQALMTAGTGFHPEHTGRENILGSLQYNGLQKSDYEEAFEGIVDFCELGEFLDQPLKTYSLGMQARLMFATATAIKPDILIVDEVLGAGDAYFVAKSKQRVSRLIESGCTMLLVSHSMQQVLELCEEAIWLEQGRIRMRGPAFEVVKAYESALHAPIARLEKKEGSSGSAPASGPHFAESAGQSDSPTSVWRSLQEPVFRPNEAASAIDRPDGPLEFRFVARDGVARWGESRGLEFTGFTIVDERGESNRLLMLSPVEFVMEIRALADGAYRCRYALNISDHDGRSLCAVRSGPDAFELQAGSRRRVSCLFNPLQLGPGEYVVGVVVMAYGPLELIHDSERYDLLSRSFTFTVEAPAALAAAVAQFIHSAEWQFTS